MWGGEGVFGGLEQAGFGGQRPGPRPRDLAWERRRAGGAAPSDAVGAGTSHGCAGRRVWKCEACFPHP